MRERERRVKGRKVNGRKVGKADKSTERYKNKEKSCNPNLCKKYHFGCFSSSRFFILYKEKMAFKNTNV